GVQTCALPILTNETTEHPQRLSALSDEAQRYSKAFGVDDRLSGLRADLANRWYDAGDFDQALGYAKATLDWENAGQEERYAAWLVIARVQHRNGEYGLAERAWRQALGLA